MSGYTLLGCAPEELLNRGVPYFNLFHKPLLGMVYDFFCYMTIQSYPMMCEYHGVVSTTNTDRRLYTIKSPILVVHPT